MGSGSQKRGRERGHGASVERREKKKAKKSSRDAKDSSSGDVDDSSAESVQAPKGDDVHAAVVFQCSSCLTIVGDSFAWALADEENEVIVLKAASNCLVEGAENAQTSTVGPDKGSTYLPFTCSNCHAHLGKMYVTTPRHLDDLRDIYTFNSKALRCYQLGSGETAQSLDLSYHTPPVHTFFPSTQWSQYITERIAQISELLIGFAERITALEDGGGGTERGDLAGRGSRGKRRS